MSNKEVISDFIKKYRNYVIYAFISWFLITAIIAYMILASSEDLNMMMCFGHLKAKFRSLFFFLPDNWFSGITIKAGTGHFRRLIVVWNSIFAEYGWKLYLYVFGTFAISKIICGVCIYVFFKKQLQKFHQNVVITGKILETLDFQKKYPDAFGNHLNFAGLNLSRKILQTPFYVWGNDESLHKTIDQFLSESRTQKRKIVVFEEGNTLFKCLAEKDDVLLNPTSSNGISWNFLEDLKFHENILLEDLMRNIHLKEKYAGMEDLIKHLINTSVDTKGFFQTLCFDPFDDIKLSLKHFTNIKDNKDTLINIRNQISNDLYSFKTLLSKEDSMSFHEYHRSNHSVLWISCENNAQLQSLIPLMEKIIDADIIKISIGEKLIKPTTNTIVLNHSLENSYKLYGENMLILSKASKHLMSLLGDSITEYPLFLGIKYKKHTEQIISEMNGGSFFKYGSMDDVLRLPA